MRLVLISDTHGLHGRVSLPDGDILVHAGDLSMEGSVYYVQLALDWMNEQTHKHVVFVAGNHDFAFERAKNKLDLGRMIYLENDGTAIEGITFWGSPVQPWFCDWAFNVQRGAAIKKYWDMIPNYVDVLITHGPPMGRLDQSVPDKSDHLGCEELEKRVDDVNPKIHVFGHIHGSYGMKDNGATKFVNASLVNEAYKIVNEPMVIEL